MKIMYFSDAANGSALIEATAPRPKPGPEDLLIRVYAAGVTPTELLWYPTSHFKTGQRRTRTVPGHEFSGVVVGVGSDVGDLEIEQPVFGMNDWFADGATAEYCVAPFAAVAPKPTNLTHAEAASVPIAGLTAWQGLFDHANLQPGERVLVHGGAGAVGVLVIQLARIYGAHVIATASTRNHDLVTNLGAHRVVDYQTARFEDCVGEVDIVFDTVGGETLERSWKVLKPGGRLVTIASGGATTTDERVKRAFFVVEPNQKQLSEIAALLENRRLVPVLDAVVPFSEASKAYMGSVERRRRGKLVVEVAA